MVAIFFITTPKYGTSYLARGRNDAFAALVVFEASAYIQETPSVPASLASLFSSIPRDRIRIYRLRIFALRFLSRRDRWWLPSPIRFPFPTVRKGVLRKGLTQPSSVRLARSLLGWDRSLGVDTPAFWNSGGGQFDYAAGLERQQRLQRKRPFGQVRTLSESCSPC